MTTEDFLRFLNEEKWPPVVGYIILIVTTAREADCENMAWKILLEASKVAHELNNPDVDLLLYAAAKGLFLKFVNRENLITQLKQFNHFMEAYNVRNQTFQQPRVRRSPSSKH